MKSNKSDIDDGNGGGDDNDEGDDDDNYDGNDDRDGDSCGHGEKEAIKPLAKKNSSGPEIDQKEKANVVSKNGEDDNDTMKIKVSLYIPLQTN
jgi:hypothetical protein